MLQMPLPAIDAADLPGTRNEGRSAVVGRLATNCSPVRCRSGNTWATTSVMISLC